MILKTIKFSRATLSAFVHKNIFAAMVHTNSSPNVEDIKEEAIKKSVFISQSNDIFTNLALEDWMYKNYDFTHHHVLMLWFNDPCVVIGRHQNPWSEANVEALPDLGVKLARRHSGGGTVYHDHGNLNLTFFTPRSRYNRSYNLQLISNALYREWNLKADISKRSDITVKDNFKISGTAAKLGRLNSYHHCTLLVDVNKVNLHAALQKNDMGFKTTATKSIPSSVINLNEINSKVTVDSLISAIGWEWLKTPAIKMSDEVKTDSSTQNGFQLINPTDDWFPGLNEYRDVLKSWDWLYGKTPKFTVVRNVPIIGSNSTNGDLNLNMEVNQGKISEVTLNVPEGLSTKGFHGQAHVYTNLEGEKFNNSAIIKMQNLFCELPVAKCNTSPSQSAQQII